MHGLQFFQVKKKVLRTSSFMCDVCKEGCNFPLNDISRADGPETGIGSGSLEKCCPSIEASARAASTSLISNLIEK